MASLIGATSLTEGKESQFNHP